MNNHDHEKDFQIETPLRRWWPLFTLLILSAAAAVLAALKTGDMKLPWWYSKMLRWMMPTWLMPILERPWFITGAMIVFFISKLAVVAFLTAQLVLTRRKLARLIEAHRSLQRQHEELQRSIDVKKYNEHITNENHTTKEQDESHPTLQ